ncbi:MAG TPA: GntR family transcriptional regulator [Solirubrobacteraceae bacterium]
MAEKESSGTVSTFQPLQELRGNVKLSDRIINEFEERIVSGALAPGERLPTESELCELLDVSRSVVRDAMRTLAARGLLEVRQGRGMIVTPPDDNAYSEALTLLLARSDLRMSDIFDARAVLETQIGLLAVAASDTSDVEALDGHLTSLKEAIEEKDWLRASDSHVAFHAALLHALHLPALDKLLEPMQQLIVPSAAPPLSVDDLWDVDAHVPIVEALRARDLDAMKSALERHYARSRASAEEEWLNLPFRDAARISREHLEQRAR